MNDNAAAARYGEQLRREFPESAEIRLLDGLSRSPG
jgi:Tfp pilus assembly protein PilF